MSRCAEVVGISDRTVQRGVAKATAAKTGVAARTRCGPAMKGATLKATLERLGIFASYSRPQRWSRDIRNCSPAPAVTLNPTKKNNDVAAAA